jgi:hypothetical protein
MWGDIKIVYGKPCHIQTQGSIECANRDIEKMLASWMADNNGIKICAISKKLGFELRYAIN